MDYGVVAIVALMLALGLALVFSASYAYKGTYFFLRQVVWIVAGLAAAIIMARIPYRYWRPLSVPIILAAIALLIAVLFFGENLNGARRTFGGSIQPGEIAKLAVVIYVSAWAVTRGRRISDAREGLLPFAIIMGIMLFLLVLEPSFSVAIIVAVIGVAIFFVAGGSVGQMALLGLIAAPIILLLMWQSGYAAGRIEDWVQVLRTPGQVSTDTIAVWQKQTFGAESILDRITGVSSVPLPWSDYIFAYTADKLGFLGALLVVVLYAALAYRMLAIAINAPDHFGQFMAVGVTAWVVVQALIHIGASMSLLPETGQPLPFMSYGGSSMFSVMAAIGLMQSIARASPARTGFYETLTLGGWNRRPRLPDPNRDQRAQTPRPRRTAPGAAYGHNTRAVDADDVTGPAWRRGSPADERKPRRSTTRKQPPKSGQRPPKGG
jgi:cell division protein FtsW